VKERGIWRRGRREMTSLARARVSSVNLKVDKSDPKTKQSTNIDNLSTAYIKAQIAIWQ